MRGSITYLTWRYLAYERSACCLAPPTDAACWHGVEPRPSLYSPPSSYLHLPYHHGLYNLLYGYVCYRLIGAERADV